MKTMTVDELQSEFDDCWDENERLQLILEFGRELDPLADEFKTDEHRVLGCASRVWVVSRVEPGSPPTLHFDADSDGQTARGLIAILLALVNDKPPQEILAMDLNSIFERLDLARYVTRSRTNGLASMIERVRNLARANQTQK
jgi:cysteine desulfuration protein SufE